VNTSIDALFEELDRSAIQLLKEAMGGALQPGEGDANLPAAGGSLNEKTRVFSAIAAYAKSRETAKPDKKPEQSKFNDLREQFRGVHAGGHGGASERGTRGGKKAASEANGASASGTH
jgi:hypothetical protein